MEKQDNTTEFKMPFGKHKYENIQCVPTKYLDWLLGQDWLKQKLKEQILIELKQRPEWVNMEKNNEK